MHSNIGFYGYTYPSARHPLCYVSYFVLFCFFFRFNCSDRVLNPRLANIDHRVQDIMYRDPIIIFVMCERMSLALDVRTLSYIPMFIYNRIEF